MLLNYGVITDNFWRRFCYQFPETSSRDFWAIFFNTIPGQQFFKKFQAEISDFTQVAILQSAIEDLLNKAVVSAFYF